MNKNKCKTVCICGAMGNNLKKNKIECITKTLNNLVDFIVHNKLKVLYSGTEDGLLGILAKILDESSCDLTGALVENELDKKYKKLNKEIIFDSYSKRRDYLFEQSDLLIFLPGGLGTLDEFFCFLLKLNTDNVNKKILLWNFSQFWAPVYDMFSNMEHYNFIESAFLNSVNFINDISGLESFKEHFL